MSVVAETTPDVDAAPTVRTSTGSGSAPGSLRYQPALDGIRAIAVIGTLAFHNGFSWIAGGFLGVSTFFTLSGFLITSLLVSEREATGEISLARFWSRRFRRLLPGALSALGLILAFGWFLGNSVQQAGLRGDVLWSLLYGANWHFIGEGTSYADIFQAGAESPAQHFWSLGIEEQFYLIFPLVAFGSMILLKASRRRFGVILGVLWGLSIAASLAYGAMGWSDDRIYFGTETRAAELLAGAVLAVIICGRETIANRRVRSVVEFAGPSFMSVAFLFWALTDLGTGWLYRGGFGAYSIVSALLILAAVQPRGLARYVLSVAPMRWIGRISYGIYLYHWPVFIYLRDRSDLADWPRFLVGAAVTIALAEVSYRFIEMPIRSGSWSTGRRPAIALPVGAAAVLVTALVSTAGFKPLIDFDTSSIEEPGDDVISDSGTPRVAFFGDSIMLTLTKGLGAFVDRDPDLVRAGGVAGLGCGIGRTGWRQYLAQPVVEVDNCWETPWAEGIERIKPDVAVVMAGVWDVTDRWLPGDDPKSDPPRYPGDPTYDEYLLNELLAATDLLSAKGAKVVWLTSPYVELGMIDGELPEVTYQRAYTDAQGRRHYVGSDPARMDRFNELIKQVPELRPGVAAVVDLEGFLSQQASGPVTPDLKPDGVHFTEQGAIAVADGWLGDQLVGTIRGLISDG